MPRRPKPTSKKTQVTTRKVYGRKLHLKFSRTCPDCDKEVEVDERVDLPRPLRAFCTDCKIEFPYPAGLRRLALIFNPHREEIDERYSNLPKFRIHEAA